MIFKEIRERLQKAESVKCYGSRNSGNYMIPLKDAISIVEQAKTEYNNGWILCSSGQMPKDDEHILYCGNHLTNMDVDSCFGEWFLNHLDYMLGWQPLPQPPKGE